MPATQGLYFIQKVSNATENNIPIFTVNGSLADSGISVSDVVSTETMSNFVSGALSNAQIKIAEATEGNLATIDASGQTIDSGYSPTSFSAANHTHSTYAAASHAHAISDVTNLQTTLNAKANTDHTHTTSQITADTVNGLDWSFGITGIYLTANGISLTSADLSDDSPGSISLTGGNTTKNDTEVEGGDVDINAGNSQYGKGGDVAISAGSGATEGGDLFLAAGVGATPGQIYLNGTSTAETFICGNIQNTGDVSLSANTGTLALAGSSISFSGSIAVPKPMSYCKSIGYLTISNLSDQFATIAAFAANELTVADSIEIEIASSAGYLTALAVYDSGTTNTIHPNILADGQGSFVLRLNLSNITTRRIFGSYILDSDNVLHVVSSTFIFNSGITWGGAWNLRLKWSATGGGGLNYRVIVHKG